eukprot:9192825-Lingulodinium_polyedra.AAC.1
MDDALPKRTRAQNRIYAPRGHRRATATPMLSICYRLFDWTHARGVVFLLCCDALARLITTVVTSCLLAVKST